uniref:Uncharacterized protein n=1 Tax=Arundo donax TaxID=35708 RepID=A0A0A9A3T1_ARUDO
MANSSCWSFHPDIFIRFYAELADLNLLL